MKLWKATPLLLIGVMVAGCVTYVDPQRFGTYAYKGMRYDVYTVIKRTDSDGADDEVRRILVPFGTSPSRIKQITPIAKCNPRFDSQKECDKIFGRALERRLKTENNESGSDY